ncbi:MAG TPA: ribosomal protein S18-alanine N-acetyltransferase [Clostridiaceae bacterium]|nr:ribosomal protein S18-alanine N-acetyltransferase [Clostridiaceae bacterium]
MSEKVRIRLATSKDLTSIVEIYLEAFEKRFGGSSIARDLQEAEANSPYSLLYFVAETGAGIMGYISACPLPDVMDIYELGVRSEARKQGIGRLLMNKIIDEAFARQIDLLMLEVATGNSPAISLYEDFGFYIYGRRKHYYQDTGEDALLMRLDLDL